MAFFVNEFLGLLPIIHVHVGSKVLKNLTDVSPSHDAQNVVLSGVTHERDDID